MTQPASSTTTSSSTPPPVRGNPSPVGRGATRGGTESSVGPNRFYAIRRHQHSEASTDVVTGVLTVHSHDVYALIDLRSTLSYVTPYVYRDCVVIVLGRDTMVDLIELGMVDFDIIMGMDWLYSCFAKLDCQTRSVRFDFPNEPVIKWKGDDVVPKGRFI
ncbi:uncharacterized protein [Nicotiana tomentosiformis]|uniref:uncharacterized protein n=1 Tax=Nicotiana tomentosiformis TaxID=4098 RepID=UPI00388CEB96